MAEEVLTAIAELEKVKEKFPQYSETIRSLVRRLDWLLIDIRSPSGANLSEITAQWAMHRTLRKPIYEFFKELMRVGAVCPDGPFYSKPYVMERDYGGAIKRSGLVEVIVGRARHPNQYRIKHPKIVTKLLFEYERAYNLNR